MSSPGERTSVIVIRLWQEPDHGTELRARIAAVRDVDKNEVQNTVASSVEEIVEIVREFVASVTAA